MSVAKSRDDHMLYVAQAICGTKGHTHAHAPYILSHKLLTNLTYSKLKRSFYRNEFLHSLLCGKWLRTYEQSADSEGSDDGAEHDQNAGSLRLESSFTVRVVQVKFQVDMRTWFTSFDPYVRTDCSYEGRML